MQNAPLRKEPTSFTKDVNSSVADYSSLPDVADFEIAKRGFIVTIPNGVMDVGPDFAMFTRSRRIDRGGKAHNLPDAVVNACGATMPVFKKLHVNGKAPTSSRSKYIVQDNQMMDPFSVSVRI
jgi:hypothetical protein